ncbi:MAG: hypothetical protein ACREDD_11420 [Methylocella sp.]
MDAVESAQSAAAESIMGEAHSAAGAASTAEPASAGEMAPAETVTAKGPAEVTAAEVPAEVTAKVPAEVTAAEVTAAEVPAEVPAEVTAEMTAAEVPAEVPAEMTAAEMAAAEMAEAAEMTAAEVSPAETSGMTATAEVTAAAAVPKGKSFAHDPRRHARRERGLEAEPERQRRCENFPDPTNHCALLPAEPLLLRTQTHGRFRKFRGIEGPNGRLRLAFSPSAQQRRAIPH